MSATFRCPTCGKLNRVDPTRAGAKCGSCKTTIDGQNKPFQMTDDSLKQLIASSPVPVLVDFYADWCGPCRHLGPILEQLADKHKGALLVAKIDTERDKRTASELGVQGIPAVFLFNGGRLVDKSVGLKPLPAMDAFVRPHLG